MESKTLTKSWGQILIPLVILTVSCVPGMQAMWCWGTCGEGTYCWEGQCRCFSGYYGLRTVPGSNVKVCWRGCWSRCSDSTKCKTVHSWNGNRRVCVCSVGTELSARGQCQDIDECARNRNICGSNSICANTDGSYKCACAEGYKRKDGDKIGCNQDINECAEKPSVCGNNSICTNIDGNYTCACAEGYRQIDDELVGCSQDIDECTESPHVCGNNSVCTNTDGNYTCACAEGYRQRKGEEVSCSQEIDECAEIPAICGNNSVCTNTEGNYTCACADGYIQRGDEEIGCSQSAAASTAADSSALTIGLAVGIGGVVLLAVIAVVVVVVVRGRNRPRAGVREDTGLDTQGKRSDITAHTYENVAGQPHGVNNSMNPASSVLPDVLCASSHFPSNTAHSYEEVDLPPQAQQGNDPGTLYSLAGDIEERKRGDSNKYKDLYSNNKIADNKRKQLDAKKIHVSETFPRDSTYNVLSKPYVKPSVAADNTPDNYTTLYDINLESTTERPGDLQPCQTEHGSPHGKADVEYDTTYFAARQSEDKGVLQTSNDQENGSEYDELKVQRV